MYKVNDYVVYKRETCKINNITTSKYSKEEVYVLAPISDNTLKIEVPTKSANMRSVIDRDFLDSLVSAIPSIETIDLPDKQLEVEYKRLMGTDNVEDLVRIIKTAYLNTKERTDKKRRARDKDVIYFEKAEKCLYNEFSVVLNKSYDETKAYIMKKLESN